MDLPDLLEPERIRCRCDIHSKKRALQTLAELLGAALRADGEDGQAAGERRAGDGAGGAAIAGADDGGGKVSLGKTAKAKARDRIRDRGGKTGKEGDKPRARTNGASEEEAESPDVSDMDILDALISRERLGSTGIGHGVALPHSRLDVVDAPLAALITLNDGVDFESSDGEAVDLVLGLLVPRDCNDEHLQILANLARRFNDADFRETLRDHDSGDELFAHLQRLPSAS